MQIVQTIGNQSLWEREKTLFLTSKMAPFSCYEKVFQWVENFDMQQCAVCFNTSEFEREVLKALLVNCIPTTLIVLNKFHDTFNVQIEKALKENRLLIMVMKLEKCDGKGFPARLRNKYLISQVQHIACGYINTNGSIFGLLAGCNNITYLLNKADICQAAETAPKPARWTVVEDKRLLHMFYADMGIHAIHKAINRPYSTIYTRIKSLTMSDDLLKGREFEDYVLERMDIPNNDKLILKEWRSDKSLPGVYPKNNSAPDFVFEYDEKPFAIECKWRNSSPQSIEEHLLSADRVAFFKEYATKHRMPVFLLLGIGGLPCEPDGLFLYDFDNDLSLSNIFQTPISSIDNLLSKIQLHVSSKNVSRYLSLEEKRKTHPNVGKPWTKEDDQHLAILYQNGESVAELMVLFQRNRGGIISRLRKLGLRN